MIAEFLKKRWRNRGVVLVTVLTFGFVAGLALAAYSGFSLLDQAANGSAHRTQTSTLSPTVADQVDARYGIQVTRVAVTAAGGLVVVRFRVEDRVKAQALLQPGMLPAIIADGGKVTIPPPERPEVHALSDGQVVSQLYPNTDGAVRPGSTITLDFGDLGLEYQAAP